MATSISTGVWSASTTWDTGVVPSGTTSIVLNHAVTLDGVQSSGPITINTTGVMYADRLTASSLVTSGNITVNTGGTLDLGRVGDTVVCDIQLASGMGVVINGGGHIFAHGSVSTTHTTLSTQATKQLDLTITVASSTGWKIGDVVKIITTASGRTHWQDEERTITALAGNTVTFSGTLSYNHEIGGVVCNMSKSVRVHATTGTAYIKYTHTGSSAIDDCALYHIELLNMGANVGGRWGAITISGSGTETLCPFTSISDVTIRGTALSSIDMFQIAYRYQFANIVCYGGTRGFAPRQTAIATFTDSVFAAATDNLRSFYSQGGTSCQFDNCWFIGASNSARLESAHGFVFNNSRFASNNNDVNPSWGATHIFNSCVFGYVFGLYNGSSSNNIAPVANALTTIQTNGCTFNALNQNVLGATNTAQGFSVVLADKNIDPLQQEIYLPAGTLFRDNVIVRNSISSLRIEPLSTSTPIKNEWDIIAPNATPVNVAVYVRKNTSYGSSTLPKITLGGLGITPSVASMTDVNDVWQVLFVSGQQLTGADGILTLTLEAQSGNVGAKCWITDLVAPAAKAVTSGGLEYWASGQPAKLVAANFTSANDVWNGQVVDMQLGGSMAQYITQPFHFTNIDIDEHSGEAAQSISLSALSGKIVSLKIYRADAPTSQVGTTITMTEPTPETYLATIDWVLLGGSAGYYIIKAESGIHSDTVLVELHSDTTEGRVWSHSTRTLTLDLPPTKGGGKLIL